MKNTEGNPPIREKEKRGRSNHQWMLLIYDVLIFFAADFFSMELVNHGTVNWPTFLVNSAICLFVILLSRVLIKVYRQVWRYGGIQCYLRLMIADAMAFIPCYVLIRVLETTHALAVLNATSKVGFAKLLSMFCVNLLACLAIRMVYRYAFKCSHPDNWLGRVLGFLLKVFSGEDVRPAEKDSDPKIKVAIIGAGRVGVSFAEELLNNPASIYKPVFFVDNDQGKSGRQIYGVDVLPENEKTMALIRDEEVQEIVLALQDLNTEKRKYLYELYKPTGCKIKVYDYPTTRQANGKRELRSFDVEDLLFRKPIVLDNEKTTSYFTGKTVLVTGGGGSIGSELCRQIARMNPKRLIILDVFENGAYNIQQELKILYKDALDLKAEIVSVTNRIGLERVFREHHPDIVIHAAAHKHVPLMEKNVLEAVENNVFGTLNTVLLSVQYGVQRFHMVSTDKAVNPTNVMGATKRMCELIVKNFASRNLATTFSATRFGNVLGSAGSVIPLFRRQISEGGPVTVTDKRIIRYFMTIPEASQLVLESASMAKNGELFVLDMGEPVKILDLAENMIRLAGYRPYVDIQIQEVGLRPGEKLYEELLVKSGNCEMTENSTIYIEKEDAVSDEELEHKLSLLRDAIEDNSDDGMRKALHQAVETFVEKTAGGMANAAENAKECVKETAEKGSLLSESEKDEPTAAEAAAAVIR